VVKTVPGTVAEYHDADDGAGACTQPDEKLGRFGSGFNGQPSASAVGVVPPLPRGPRGANLKASEIFVAVGGFAETVAGGEYGVG
jgi:hypothetical protein